MGLVIKTDGKPVMVVRQDKTSSNGKAYTQYSLMVSSKNTEGAWISGFIDCQFKKGVEVANKTKININNSFYTVNEYNGKKYIKLFVLDFEVAEPGEAPQTVDSDGFMNVVEGISEELPFM